jgi:hypothetical protein
MTLDEVAAVALGLPGVDEVVTWETERTFRVRNKIFVMGAPESSAVSVRTSLEEQRELVASDPGTFAVSPYTGRFGWTRVVLSTVDPGELAELIVEAWRRTATKKAVAAYDAARTSP